FLVNGSRSLATFGGHEDKIRPSSAGENNALHDFHVKRPCENGRQTCSRSRTLPGLTWRLMLFMTKLRGRLLGGLVAACVASCAFAAAEKLPVPTELNV